MRLFALILPVVFMARCASSGGTAPAPAPPLFGGELTDYWHRGEAEITTYDLQQARYGELREGEAILIQVTEDFLVDTQVKNETYTDPNSTPAIKTNLIKRFTTGIYDYSLMTSVFTPTDLAAQPRTLKVTTSAQDWCGQSFTQLNYAGGDEYAMQLRSYFEREGDRDETLAADFLEDEVMNRIRMAGTELPQGTFRVVPATAYLLMTHQPYAATSAELSVTDGPEAASALYVIDYSELERRIEIEFERAAPHRILGWRETYRSRDKVLTTIATARERTQAPYWELNAVVDGPRRDSIGLQP